MLFLCRALSCPPHDLALYIVSQRTAPTDFPVVKKNIKSCEWIEISTISTPK
jgi:hypothetical protein